MMKNSEHSPARRSIELQMHFWPALAVDERPLGLTLKHGFALMARLADARGRLSRAGAAALLWPDASTAVARTRLRRLVHELNRRLGLAWICGDADTLWVDTDAATLHCDWLQVRRIARRVLRGEALSPQQAAPLLSRHADRLLDGFALGSDTFDDWLDGARREHAALVAKALLQLALHWLDQGEPVAAQTAAERLVRLEPCSEPAHACLIAARAELGDAPGVEAAYHDCASALRQELGIRPSPLLENAYAAAAERCREADHAVVARLLARLSAPRDARRTPAGRPPATMPGTPVLGDVH
jgi:DNA-binding SARP family transcriptional activator